MIILLIITKSLCSTDNSDLDFSRPRILSATHFFRLSNFNRLNLMIYDYSKDELMEGMGSQ